ncbi:MAG: 30S ribosomal protein S16 [Clostridiales bacterium]|jgi:small subunit ribosomal protein S16|nr:30S ribosomal protein S16 [Clostridiales bacterium]
MVKIRLTRLGDKKTPFYRVIVADSRAPRDGRFIDTLGSYNPLANPEVIKIDGDKAKKWIADGAQPTDTARALLVRAGIIEQGKRAPAKTGSVKKNKTE